MVANPPKIQLLFLDRSKSLEKKVSFVGKAIKCSSTIELLTLDKNLNFKNLIENICCKANNKIKTLFPI